MREEVASGGQRVALSVAAIAGAIAGVLACRLALPESGAGAQVTVHVAPAQEVGENGSFRHTSILTFTPVTTAYLPLVARNSGLDKWALWTGSTQLRGANIYQRRVYPDLDDGMLGYGPVGPPYTQAGFDQLAVLGANCVNISHPGLFTETAPYTVDLDIQNHLDSLLNMISNADMFAVISFRTGPGRAEFSVCCLEDAGDWYPASYLDDRVWEDQAAQDGWAAMWRYTAARYRDNPTVVGYDLMVEPNANEVVLDDWLDPEDFYDQYGGTLADWNQLYPDVTAAIREVDARTPILIGGMGYSGVDWLPYLQPTGDPRTVYLVHQYEPFGYTHQEPGAGVGYPSGSFDRDDLDELLSTVGDFKATHGVPVAVNEFGVQRWAPGADAFMDDQMDLFEQRGLNHALWVWDPSYGPWTEEVNSFNFRFGPNPDNDSPVPNALQNTIVEYWSRNAR